MKFHRNHFFLKLLCSGLLLSTIPVIALGILSYLQASEMIQRHVKSEKLHLLRQTQLNIERVLQMIDHSVTDLLNSAALDDVWQEPDSARQIELWRELSGKLTLLQAYDAEIDEISLVNLSKSWRLDHSGLYSIEDRREFDELIDTPNQTVWKIENNKTDNGDFTLCPQQIKLVKKIPTREGRITGLLVAEISACKFHRLIASGLESHNLYISGAGGVITLADSGGNLAATIQGQDMLSRLNNNDNGAGQFETTAGESRYSVLYEHSALNGWAYVTAFPLEALTNPPSHAIGRPLFYICLLLVGVTLLLSWLGSRKVYDPIEKLVRTVADALQLPGKPARLNELLVIEEHVDRLKELQSKLESQLDGQANQLKIFFQIQLFQGDLKKREIEQKLQAFGFQAKRKKFTVLTLQIDALDDTRYEDKDHDLLLFAIHNMLEEIIPAADRLGPVPINRALAMLLFHDTENEHDLKDETINLTTLVQKTVNNYLHLKVSIGVSLPFPDIEQAHIAYQQSREALKYRIRYGQEVVLHYGDVQVERNLYFSFPQHLENELADAVKIADLPKAKSVLHQLIRDIFDSEPSPSEYQISVVRLLVVLLSNLQNIGVYSLELSGGRNSLMEQLLVLQTRQEVEEWFARTILVPSIAVIQERMDNQYKRISDEIVQIIHQEFNNGVTLEYIATRLHYNANYLSSIFRKEMDISFTEYLSLHRHNMAKKWLLETDMPIKDIADRLQYNNSQNFIRSFRKVEGVTPGKFRADYGNLTYSQAR